jgi:ankyrin repeat protein
VYCQLDYLGDCLPGRIRRALDELPESLDGTYERSLRELKDTNWEFSRRLFLCVAVASRPLRVEELAEFLAFDFESGPIPKFREDWRLEEPLEAVLSTCSTLLSLVDVDDSQVIQFSHFSVKEFLTSSRFAQKCDTISRRYHVSMTPAHTVVAQVCLGILLHLDKNVTRESLTNFPLAEYAAKHWVEHARFEGVSENAEEGMKQLFDASKPHLAIWIWIHSPYPQWRSQDRGKRPSPPCGTPLHYAALCGLHTVVKFLAIEHSRDVHSQGGNDESTPLHLASEKGHVEVVRILVEHGADTTVQDNHGSTPLHRASWPSFTNIDLVRFLIMHGADVMAQNKFGSTPLHGASSSGNVDVARFLVEHGADATAQDKDGWTPLHHASFNGSVGLARFLVEHGADPIAQDKDGATPLHGASWGRNMDVVRFLVEHGADVTAQDKHGLTPLHLAPSPHMGNVDLERFLVEHGADVKVRDWQGWTPLHYASLRGNVDLARFLVECGADVSVRGKDGSTPLHNASENGHADLAQFLVERGADATALDKDA